MTALQRKALARTPMPAEQVERIYAAHLPAVSQGLCRLICDLCESHERLRAELQGAEVLLEDAERIQTERDKLQRFKDYVHQRLDLADVPADPESPHRVEGCRIGGRLDVLIGARDELLSAARAIAACPRVRDGINGQLMLFVTADTLARLDRSLTAAVGGGTSVTEDDGDPD
jgi:hypothetical protein